MKTAQEYIDSIRAMHHEAYLFGEKIENPVDHPIIRPSINSVAATYELAEQSEWESLMTATSHLTGKRINRFTHIHQGVDDLVAKSKMNRMLGAYTGSCFQRCVGMDALNALSIVTHKLASKDRFLDYLQYVQDNDLVCCGAMTDAKGNRSLRPSEQFDPDQYLNVIGRGKDGIVVSGAKLHQTGAINSHEIIVMPTRAMSEKDKDYAVSFAIPSDTKGIMYIYGRQSCDMRKHEEGFDRGNVLYGGQECMVIFNNVFVPWERVFMCGEYEFTGQLVEQFAAYHRHSYACKSGIGDVLIGAVQLLAQYQGTDKASHIKDKIVEMIHFNETLACGSLACAYEGHEEPSGTYAVNPLLANVAKLNVTRLPFEIARLAQEIAGGILGTMPSYYDYSSKIGRYVAKYLKPRQEVKTEDRMRVLRLIENLCMGSGAVSYLTESMHGAGSPQAQRIMIQRLADMTAKASSAKRLCGVKE